jgi:hypothetical protein
MKGQVLIRDKENDRTLLPQALEPIGHKASSGQNGVSPEQGMEFIGRILTKTLVLKVFCKAPPLLAEQPGLHRATMEISLPAQALNLMTILISDDIGTTSLLLFKAEHMRGDAKIIKG